MRVALVTSFPRDIQAPQGGVEAVSVNLAAALGEWPDLDVHVVTLDFQSPIAETSRTGNFTVHRLPSRKSSTLLNALFEGRRTVIRSLRQLEPDVVHSHDTYGLMVKGLAVPKVFTVHGFIHADTRVSGRKLPRWRARVWEWIETRGWEDQPHIIAISPYVSDRVSRTARGVLHAIENPVSEAYFRLERKSEPGTIFSSAIIAPRKNTLALIAAFRIVAGEIPSARLRLAGRTADPGYGRRVMESIRACGLGEKVRLLGAVDTAGVKRELSHAAVYALVSLEENAPMGIAEAMAAGVPVVASNRCGMPFMVRDGETGFLVDPENTADIARRLRQVLAEPGLREAMATRAREHALARNHPRIVARRTRLVYEEALRSAGKESGAWD